jgi:hypothetical protein
MCDLAVLHQLVPLGEAEQAQDLFRGGACAVALFGVEGQLVNFLAFHGEAQLAFDQSLNETREEIESEERFDAPLVLEQHRGNFVHGLDLFEALLDHGLALVGLKHLGRRHAEIVGDQRCAKLFVFQATAREDGDEAPASAGPRRSMCRVKRIILLVC